MSPPFPQVTGDENAPEPPLGYKQGFPLKRWKHSAVVYQKKFVVIFGGFFNSRNRFNDVWYFDTIALAWENVVPPAAEFTPRGNHGPSATAQKEAPPPRGAHSANIIEDTMYIFGGYGGTGYGRRDYNDMHKLDLATREWKKCAARGTPPAARSGHTACAVKSSIYVFGGWNAVTQFNDMFVYDTTESQWSQCETSFGDARWNHSACSVEAIPHWKIFVFGGTKGSAA